MTTVPFDYTKARDTADRLLDKFGQAMLLRRTVNSGSETEPTQGVADYATVGVITNLTRWYPAFADNSDILRTDRLGLIGAGPLALLGITPTPFDTLVTASGIVFRIIDAKPIAPAGVAAVYSLQLRI